MTGLKVSGIFLLAITLLGYIVWILLALNNVYLESHGFVTGSEFREAYYDHVLKSASELIPYLSMFFVALFFAGAMVAKLLLRPFKIIADYCWARVEGENVAYDPSGIADYKLLNRFSDFFFQFMDDSLKKNKLEPNTIPPQFMGIHQPVFDNGFFFAFFVLIALIATLSVTLMNMALAHMREGIVDLAVKTLSDHGSGTSHFFQEQSVIFESLNTVATIVLFTLYFFLAFHLYGKVSGAVFGFFSTMRSFMKGNVNARVRLLGYNHVRPYGLAFNQYLKYAQEKITGAEKSGNK